MLSFCLMQKVFSSLATDFLKNALVVSSIDQHIASLENCINAVTTLYNPKIAPQKAGYYDKFKGCSEKDCKIITKKLQDTPEGIIINHYNTDTGKFNGHTITSKEVGQSFCTCTKQIALQAACGVPIDLWTMVHGGEDEKESYYYYRRDRLSKIVTHGGSHDAHMHVFPSLRPVDEYKAHWGTIGVDVEQHAKLPFACLCSTPQRDPQTQKGGRSSCFCITNANPGLSATTTCLLACAHSSGSTSGSMAQRTSLTDNCWLDST
mmetsp:Transcript_36369/g.91483  ORF Transcript_36369/g.91483 Transcript_36369/m.91483 type:complete len:263 (-) Transcript_36369:2332-3120(-)